MSAFLAYASRGRNAWWLYLLAALLGLVLATVIGAIVMVALIGGLKIPANLITSEMTAPTHPVVFYVSTAVQFGVILVAFFAVAKLLQNKRPADLIGAWSTRLFLVGAAAWLALIIAGALLDFAIAPQGFTLTASSKTATLALCALLALPIQTFAEEVVFRGWLTQGLLLATRRPWVASVLAGLVFGSVHIPNGVPQAVAAAAFGIFASRMAIQLGGLAFTFGLHLVNNLFGAVVIVSSSDVFKGSAGIFTQATPHLGWFDVGVEAVTFAVLTGFVLSPLGRRFAPPPEARAELA